MPALARHMQLAILAAVLAALANVESGAPVTGVAWRLALAAAALLIAPLVALIGTQRLAPAIAASVDRDDAVSRLQAIIIGLWLGAVGAVLFVARWPQIVRGNWGLTTWPLVDELVILMPVLVPLLLVWAALYRLDCAALAAACRRRERTVPPPRLGHFLWQQFRQQLGLVLIPPLAIVGIFETLATFNIAPRDIDTAWWLVVPLLAVMLLLMPLAVRRIWRTTPLGAGPLRDMLTAICTSRRCHVRELLIWHTDGMMANAAVVGLSRWLRYLLLTDLLVKRLSDPEIAAVLRHELAHLRRWHLPLRLALLILPLSIWLTIAHAWPGLESAIAAELAGYGIGLKTAASFGLPLAMLAYAVIVVGWYSRLLELDADLDACLTDRGDFDRPAADYFCQALLTLYGRTRESWLGEWLHPALQQRLATIRRGAEETGFVQAFRRRVGWVGATIVAANAIALPALLV